MQQEKDSNEVCEICSIIRGENVVLGEKNHQEQNIRKSNIGLALVGITGGAAVALSVIAAPFVTPALRKVVAAAQKAQLESVGVELNPWLVWYSRWKAWRSGVSSSTSFITHDLWKLNLLNYKNIVIFGVEEMMPQLERKLVQELSSDGLVVACRFPLPTWQPIASFGSGIDTVWLYQRP
ncbi:ATP synthase subunit C lysine N-methyltransferase isoform X2 [Macrobrachium rosenbergii]|uniref:ATP synthase subunit C lysine N-methyltransferase isoform X2 n=1 Tax=Macrobrachium rosenbergii TaxID=79674 RepID=UPI0034D5D1F2